LFGKTAQDHARGSIYLSTFAKIMRNRVIVPYQIPLDLQAAADCVTPPPPPQQPALQVPVDWLLRLECQSTVTGFLRASLTLLGDLHRLGSFRLLAQAPCDASQTWDQAAFRRRFEDRLSCVDRRTYDGVARNHSFPIKAIAEPPISVRGSIVVVHGTPCEVAENWQGHFGWPPRYVIARTMTEAELNADEARCLRLVDEVWVPTEWHAARFRNLTGKPTYAVPEPTDVGFFAPQLARPPPPMASAPFVFLSIFKWEGRKGWDLLLRAYFLEFRRAENVVLRIRTYLNFWSGPPPPIDLDPGDSTWSDGVASRIAWFAHQELNSSLDQLARLELVREVSSQEAMRDLYAGADSFVLPTRGEGWGLPIAEAMAMGLAVIATNYSGPTAYLTHTNSFALNVARTLANGQAEPSIDDIRSQMRRVFIGRAEATKRGRRARRHMAACCGVGRATDTVLSHLRRIERDLMVQNTVH